jgi:hypothetical protein
MKSLRYIVLWDLHLGAANSILTCLTEDNRETRPNTASSLLVQFAVCLREIASLSTDAKRPTLVLNGPFASLSKRYLVWEITRNGRLATRSTTFLEITTTTCGMSLARSSIGKATLQGHTQMSI